MSRAGLVDIGPPHDAGRDAHHGHVFGHVGEDHASGADLRALADADVAEDLRSRAQQHAVAHLGMPVSGFLPGAAQRDSVQHGDVVADHGGLAHHHSGGVVDQDPLADDRGGVEVHAVDGGDPALQEQGQVPAPRGPQFVGDAIGLEGLEALEVQEGHDQRAVGGGIALHHGGQIPSARLGDGTLAQDGQEHLVQGGRRDRFLGKLVRQHGGQRIPEIGTQEDAVVHQSGQHGLPFGDRAGFVSQVFPDPVGLVWVHPRKPRNRPRFSPCRRARERLRGGFPPRPGRHGRRRRPPRGWPPIPPTARRGN
jgi:hypothetical protein